MIQLPIRPLLIGALIVTLLGSLSGLVGMDGDSAWYEALAKPAWTPPAVAFGFIWPLLYVLIGAAGGLVWDAGDHPMRGPALFWFISQLALNLAWAPVFFRLHEIAPALGLALALLVAAIAATVHMGRVRPIAAWLMLPYLVWIGFACVLNLRIVQLNPGL